MFLLGGLLGGIARSVATKAAGRGVLGGLLAKRIAQSRRPAQSRGMSTSGGPAAPGPTEAPTREPSPAQPREQTEAPQSAEASPPAAEPLVAQQAENLQEVNQTAAAAQKKVTDGLLDGDKAQTAPIQQSPASPVAPPESFANQGDGTSPTAIEPQSEFGSQPMPAAPEGMQDQLFGEPPAIVVEQRSGFENKPLVFEQSMFPSAPVGAPPMAPASTYAPQFRSRRA